MKWCLVPHHLRCALAGRGRGSRSQGRAGGEEAVSRA